MHNISSFFLETPWWVYLLLYYLLTLGFKASKTQVVSIKKLVILPVIFTILSIHTLVATFQLTQVSVTTLFAAMAVGAMIGFSLVKNLKIRVDKKKMLLEIPGNWVTLILILLIFISKYYFGYEMSVDPLIVKQFSFEFTLLTVSGLCTGLFIGRLICYGYFLKRHRSTNLNESEK